MNSFRIRIALWTALLCGLVLIVFMVAMAVKVFNNMSEEAEHELADSARMIARLVEADKSEELPEVVVASINAEDVELQVIRVRTDDGRLRVKRNGWPDSKNTGLRNLRYHLKGSYTRIWRDDRPWLMLDAVAADGTEIQLAVELTEIQTEVMRITGDLFSALPFALVVVGLAAWWISRKATQPVLELTKVAERITGGELNRRIPDPLGHDELGNLSRVFNRMMDRLELSHQQAVRFSSDASHELRTPLTALQGKIEAALQGAGEGTVPAEVVGELSEQTQHLKSIVESLLFLARADAGKLELNRSPIDVGALLSLLKEDTLDLEPPEDIEIDVETETDLRLRGDERLIRLALFNLLRNALKFNEGGEGERFIRLRIRRAKVGGDTVITVSNSGPVIEERDSERIFGRFARLHASASKRGTGLGLSLARTIAELHGGTLRLESSVGGVNSFALTLPVSEA